MDNRLSDKPLDIEAPPFECDIEIPPTENLDTKKERFPVATIVPLAKTRAPRKVKFKTSVELKEYLQNNHPVEYKLFSKTPHIISQYGTTCKITAFTTVLNFHYEEKNISKKPLPITTDNLKSVAHSAEYVAKEIGSEVGRIYNKKMARDFIKKLGEVVKDDEVVNANVIFESFNQTSDSKDEAYEQYIHFLKCAVDIGRSPPVIFFDVNHVKDDRFGLPNPNGTGEHEHGAVVVGYCNGVDGFSFILGHWGHYFIVNANDLAKSAANLKDGIQPDKYYYKVEENGTKNNWFPASSQDMMDYVYEKVFLRRKRIHPDDLSALELYSIHAISQTLQAFKKTEEQTNIIVKNDITQETIQYTCSKTRGCFYPVKNDLRSTVCVIIPKSMQPQMLMQLRDIPKQLIITKLKKFIKECGDKPPHYSFWGWINGMDIRIKKQAAEKMLARLQGEHLTPPLLDIELKALRDAGLGLKLDEKFIALATPNSETLMLAEAKTIQVQNDDPSLKIFKQRSEGISMKEPTRKHTGPLFRSSAKLG